MSQFSKRGAAIVSAAILFAICFGTSSAMAGGLSRLLHRLGHSHRRAPSYQQTHRYMNSYYPKYYGGFHARQFQNIGVAPGDIGLRGNGFQQSPW